MVHFMSSYNKEKSEKLISFPVRNLQYLTFRYNEHCY